MGLPTSKQPRPVPLRTAMTIAGSDSGAGAGIQADLKTFSALGVYGTTVITAVTAQNTVGVRDYVELAPEFVAAQIDAIFEDIGADAVKTGMVASASIIAAIAGRMRAYQVRRLVVDPVMVATSGDRLLKPDAQDVLIGELLPLCLLVTPNLPEATVLTGREVGSVTDMKEACRRIHSMGPANVLLKGGHLPDGQDAVDLLYDGMEFHEYRAPRIQTGNTHGSGCTYSAAITAGLAQGRLLSEAVARAKEYVTAAIAHGLDIGHGRGPTHHFYSFW